MLALPGHFEPQSVRRALAGLLSAAFHVALFVIILLSGGRHDGVGASDTSLTKLVLIEAPDADRREGLDLTPLEPTVSKSEAVDQLEVDVEPPTSVAGDESGNELADAQPVVHPAEPSPVAMEAAESNAIEPAPTFVMPAEEKSALSQRLARLAEQFAKQPQARVAWEQDGTQYSAVLTLQRANDGTALDRVVAEVSAAGRGKNLSTRVILKHLAFSQFTQMVDRWDPMVQLHDDAIVGRFHTNSRFNVLYDAGTGPKFLGKVSTTADSFDMQARGGRRQAAIFRGGVETGASEIRLPEALQPSKWAPAEAKARVHELATDTHIKFFGDGSYTWLASDASTPQYLNSPTDDPVYFIGGRDATLYVKGVVAGKVLVYSPQKVIIEGNLTYAHDPRKAPDSRDYLGLVCDRHIEVASPGVTGPGDLEIDAAIFAGRRFLVQDIDHHRSATLRIFGSLTAGTLSASEPRFATKIDYDERFEQYRPPGFPATNRFEAEDWDGLWMETPERPGGTPP